MEKEPVYIAFCNQKGGVGKSTFTILSASYLHYALGRNAAIIDCDFPQWSISEVRRREEGIIQSAPYYQALMVEQYTRTGQRIYPIAEARPDTAMQSVLSLARSDNRDFDVVFFDLPGTINTEGVLSTIAALDYIFIPICADLMIMESALAFAHIIKESVIGKHGSRLKDAYLFWTQIDRRERTPLYDQFEGVMRELSLPVLSTHIPDLKRFKKELSTTPSAVYRSTLFPPDRRFVKESYLSEFLGELCAITNLV